MLAEVVLPVPLDQTFTYAVPDALEVHARPGARVLVPFGTRRLTGVITSVQDGAGEEGLKPIEDVLDEEPSLTPEMLRLTRWIADYYVSGWGEVVKAALPTGTDVETQHLVRLAPEAPAAPPPDELSRNLLAYLSRKEDATLGGLRKQFRGLSLAHLRRLERQGFVTLEVEMSQARVRVKRERHVRATEAYAGPEALEALASTLKARKQAAVLRVLAEFARNGAPEPRAADLLARAEAGPAVLRTLEERGVVEVFEQEVVRSPFGGLTAGSGQAPEHEMHDGQRRALEKILEATAAKRFQAFLLHGVTGSGKTEVYIAALKHVLEQGKTGIILVPEIALTPQTVRRFQAHFGDRIAVLHSRMSLGERYDTWRELRRGRYSVVIGPRSAIFAPLANLGLIVVDEEHEGSYKQFDPAPRYHARDVAVVRAQMNGAVCVLGSATPSIESYMNAETGKYTLLSMPDRVPVAGRKAAPLPVVQIVDLALEKKKHQLPGAFSVQLRDAIRQRLERKEQVILLQNRRGYAPVIECYSCGWTPFCSNCSVTMTYHKSKRHLRCHYCGRTLPLPNACPKCGEDDLELLGTGTQRVEEELAELFPEARLIRMDLDTTGRKDAHFKLLSRFGRGEADVLIGTQMVAKGLDFPRVTLVGVVNADAGMLLPDFRAEERTFQLLTQVAGRAGRHDLRGEVILQTRNPKHVVLRYAREHDYLGFVEAVLPDRKQFGYPPFGRVAGVEFRGPNQETVREMARRWTELFREQAAGLPGLQVLGPEAAFVGRIKRLYRYHTIIKASRQGGMPEVQNLLRHTARLFGTPPRDHRIAIDVDAVGLF